MRQHGTIPDNKPVYGLYEGGGREIGTGKCWTAVSGPMLFSSARSVTTLVVHQLELELRGTSLR